MIKFIKNNFKPNTFLLVEKDEALFYYYIDKKISKELIE
jgi:hypothetical protein